MAVVMYEEMHICSFCSYVTGAEGFLVVTYCVLGYTLLDRSGSLVYNAFLMVRIYMWNLIYTPKHTE